ncbi:MAG: metalloregulator ArsR/SmtB family transcription factor [Acidobacteria bacterium]|nr:metalloregulator ArsR/SmtB family transcription factor [Acidobacteriota bacterium]
MDDASSGRRFKAAVYGELARLGRALGGAARLELLDLLAQHPRAVEALAAEIGQSIANTSQHLQVLRRARLVEADRDGRFVRYRLASREVVALVHAIRAVGESQLAEIERARRELLEGRGAVEAIDARALRARIREGSVTVIDVRPEDEYRVSHLPGALSVPLSDLRRRLRALPRRQEIVAYCRGPYCVMAVDAVALLRRRGFNARRFELGVTEWQALGYDLAHGSPAGARP